MDYRLLRKFLTKLYWIRCYYYKRKTAIPFKIKISFYRDILRRKLNKKWQASYILLESGDYFYIPENIDVHSAKLLLKPFQYNVLIDKFCKPGTTVVDIGTNIGEWALPMAKAVGPGGSLLSFEPIPFMCNSVNRTFRVNGIFHAHCFSIALSNKTGMARFFVNYSKDKIVNSGLSSLEYPPSENSQPIDVQTTTLDEFISTHKVNRISFIKIDVEGHEYAVIEGAIETLTNHRPILIIEVGRETEEKRKFIAGVLRSLNYEMVGIVIDNGIIPSGYENFINLNNPFSPVPSHAVNVLFIPNSDNATSIY